MALNRKLKSHSQKNKNIKQRKPQRGGHSNESYPTGTRPTGTHPTGTRHPHPTGTHQPYPTRIHHGGSPASSLVMKDTTMKPVMNDYVSSPSIRDAGHDNSLNGLQGLQGLQGGSLASDLVMEQLGGVPQTKAYPNEWKVKGDINSLNTYETTGGSRRNKSKRNKKQRQTLTKKSQKKTNSRKNKKSKKSNSARRNNKNHIQRGGASDWISSQYSLGPNNNPEASASMFSQSGATSRSDYMNPSTLGLAGSGYPMGSLEGANIRTTGAPL